jgi:LysR family transcriptional regulator, nitrogen assimilation regulatory protein
MHSVLDFLMHDKVTLRQVMAYIAVCEEASFSRAAARERATQSGISQHVAALESTLGAKLVDRTCSGVHPTEIGLRFYRRCIEAVGALETGADEVRSLARKVTGELRVGLMPTFTRAALASTLRDFERDYPDVRIHIVEMYSARLPELILSEELDLAIVPADHGRIGLRSKLLTRVCEVVLSGPMSGFKRLTPLRLADVGPLKLVVPSRSNMRRRNLDIYFETQGVKIAKLIEMEGMIATLEFVSKSDYVTILPSIICVDDIARGPLNVNPLDPPLYADFVLIEPARRTMTIQAQYFLERLSHELQRIQGTWEKAIKAASDGLARPRRRRSS